MSGLGVLGLGVMTLVIYVVVWAMFFDDDNPNPKCTARPLWLKATAVALAPLTFMVIAIGVGTVMLVVACGFAWHVCRYIFGGEACQSYKTSDDRAIEFLRKVTIRLEQPPTDPEDVEKELQEMIKNYPA